MNTYFKTSTPAARLPSKDVMRQAHATRSAFVTAILIGFGKRIKGLVSGAERVPVTGVAPLAR